MPALLYQVCRTKTVGPAKRNPACREDDKRGDALKTRKES